MLTVRAAQPEDEPYLLALTRRLAAFPLPPWRSAKEIADADHTILLDALRASRGDAFLGVAESSAAERLGYVFATTRQDYFTGAKLAHVEILAVEEKAEGRGAARALMEAAEAWAVSRGYAGVTLNVFATNQRARGLYEHLGYHPETVHYVKPVVESLRAKR